MPRTDILHPICSGWLQWRALWDYCCLINVRGWISKAKEEAMDANAEDRPAEVVGVLCAKTGAKGEPFWRDEAGDLRIDEGFCLQLLRELRDVTFATVDTRGFPCARTIDVMMVEEGRLYFVTARGKAFYDQLMSTKRVAIVGQTADYRSCRLSGPVEHPSDPVEQRRLVDRVFENNPSMADVYPGEARYVLEVFYLQRGQGEYFDLSGSPILRASFTLGGEALERDGFAVGEDCIGCEACVEACPQQCIALDADDRAHIAQEHCLRCGLCQETCPTGAIVPR